MLRNASRMPAVVRAIDRRRRLIHAARHAYLMWVDACNDYNMACCDFHPSDIIIWDAGRRCKRLLRRYNLLESLLADESGVSKMEVGNCFAHWNGVCPALVATM